MVSQFLLLVEALLRPIDGPLGRRLRYWYYRKRLKQCGTNVIIDTGVVFQNPRYIQIGSNVWFDRNCLLIAGPFIPKGRKYVKRSLPSEILLEDGNIFISQGCHIAPFVVMQGHGGLYLGKNITIAAGAKVYTLSHHYRNKEDTADTKRYSFSTMAPPEDQFLILAPVILEDNCAVGLNAVVLPGTLMRAGTWLGAASFIGPGETDAYQIYSGTPANRKG